MGAIAKSRAEGVENQMALGLGDRPAHQCALGLGTVVARVAAAAAAPCDMIACGPISSPSASNTARWMQFSSSRTLHGPCVRAQLGQGRLAQRSTGVPVGSGVLGGEVRCRAGARATPAGAG